MNVFVLGTGRSGSMTFARACEHLDNYTSAHESRRRMLGPERVAYPDRHIEVDNRLSWFLGQLGQAYDHREVLYVHLRRDPTAVAASFRKRWDTTYRASIIRAFGHGIVMQSKEWGEDEIEGVCDFYVQTVTANVEEFLRHRPSVTMWLEDAAAVFPDVLDRIGAAGDLDAALAEWRTRHNASV